MVDTKGLIGQILERYDDPELAITIKATAQNGEDVLMNEYEKLHAKLVIEWASKLSGVYDSVIISAAAHDWDRAFPEIRVPYSDSKDPSLYWDYKIMHSINTANIFHSKFNQHLEPSLMSDVVYLIKRHEIGGKKANGSLIYTPDNFSNSFNLEEAAENLKIADSVGGFLALIDKGPLLSARGKDYVLKKMDFYYGRASDTAKTIIDKLQLSNPLIIDLFQEYKQSRGQVIQDAEPLDLEAKFEMLNRRYSKI